MELTIFICSLVLFASCVTGRRCPPVCQIACEYGNVMRDGCPICQCNPAPNCCPRDYVPVYPERRCNPSEIFGRTCDYNELCSTSDRSRNVGICCRRSMGPTNGRRCPPVCQIGCEYGNVMRDGCPICRCNPAPNGCPRDSVPVYPERSCNPLEPYGHKCNFNGFCSTSYRSLNIGICCRRSKTPTKVVYCPPNIIKNISTCLITKDTCVRQGDCPPSRKCCPWGCGSICLKA